MLPNKNLQHFALSRLRTITRSPSLSVCYACCLLLLLLLLLCVLMRRAEMQPIPLRFAQPKLFPLIAAMICSSRSSPGPSPSLPSASFVASPNSWALAEPSPVRAILLHSILRIDRATITWGERGRARDRQAGRERVGGGSCNGHDMRRLCRAYCKCLFDQSV